MEINLFKSYRHNVIFFLVLGLLIIIGSIIFTVYYYEGIGFDDYIMLLLGVPIGLIPIIFPFCICSKRFFTQVVLEENKCTSYSFFKKELCVVNFNKKVYFTFFNILSRSYNPRPYGVKFIAVSNEPFVCNQNTLNIFKGIFQGTYDYKKIIIFPYYSETIKLLKHENWSYIISD